MDERKVVMLKFLIKKEKTQQEKEIMELRQELEICKNLIDRNNTFFNMAVDDNLIASHIYEMQALNHQYQWIFNKLKEKEANMERNKTAEEIMIK